VLCTRCSTNLPDGSQFCLKCGQGVDARAKSVALATIPVEPTCEECGTSLPPSSEFCLKCGRPVISSGLFLSPAVPAGLESPQASPAPRRPRIVPWLLVLLLLTAMLWMATSETPAALQLQEFVRWSHVETIVDTALALKPGSFSSSEFTVPRGALSVSVAGEFSEAPSSPRKGGKSNESGKDHDTNIEAYVLTDAAFAVWRSGYSAQTQYESGPVAGANINAPLPAGAGVYHLVFSNKSSPRAKTVHATVLLRYKSWLPDAAVRLKDQFWSWIGL